MDEAMKFLAGAAAVVAALSGLFLAGRSVDPGFELFGLLLFLFGVGLAFWLIKRHFDSLDRP